MFFTTVVILLSFLAGFAMKRGGLCTYAAVLQMVHHRRLERMLVFLGSAAWATLIVLPLYWLLPSQFSLSLTHHHIQIAIIGGVILGVGAFLNKGCFFGTFVQLVSGNLNYIATLFGLSVGTIITHLYLNAYIPVMADRTDLIKPDPGAVIWLVSMLAFALFMALSFKFTGNSWIKKLAGLCSLGSGSRFAMISIGLCGGLLYAMLNGWNYADVLAKTTIMLINQKSAGPELITLLSSGAMITGGIVAAVTTEKFIVKKARLVIIASCFSGGLLMGSAAGLIPGGNDGLLLKGIPGLAVHALTGYFTMVVVMLALVYLLRRKETNC